MPLVGEDQALRLASLLREQQPQGRMVGNMYLAPGIGDYLQHGFNTFDAMQGMKEDKEQQASNAKAAISALNQYGIEAPESLIRQTQPRQSGMERLINFFKGGEQPQAYQQNVVVNPDEKQREGALLSLAVTNPELANTLLSFEKAKTAKAKEAEAERTKGVPPGFTLNDKNELVPMPIAGGGDWAKYSMDKALAGQYYINPQEQQAMNIQAANLGLAQQREKREQAKYAGEQAKVAEGKDVPANQLSSQVENFAVINQIDKALDAVRKNKGAFGAQNYLPQAITQRTDPKGVDARASVAELAATKLHDLSGATVNVGEAPRFTPFLPSATDSPEKIESNLLKMRQSLIDLENERNNMYSDGWKKQLQPLDRFNKPQQSQNSPEETKVIGGKTYHKINGEWHEGN